MKALIRDVFISLASCAGSFWYSVLVQRSTKGLHKFCIGRSDAASWLQRWLCSHSWTRYIVSCFHVNQVTVTCLFEVGDSKLNRVAKIAAIDATTVHVLSSSGREEFCAFEDWRCDGSSRCRIQYPTDSDRIPPHCQQKKTMFQFSEASSVTKISERICLAPARFTILNTGRVCARMPSWARKIEIALMERKIRDAPLQQTRAGCTLQIPYSPCCVE